MHKKLLRRNIVAALWFAALLFFSCGCLFAQDDNGLAEGRSEEGWSRIESAYFTIYHRPDANLRRINSHLNTRGISGARRPPVSALSSIEEKIAYRLDILFARVKEILGMYPPNVHINVKIFKSRREIQSEFCRLSRSTEECRSFYVFAYNTIYTSEQDISDSIIAHEMGHALIDHFFSTTPPPQTAEMLAIGVDEHLDD